VKSETPIRKNTHTRFLNLQNTQNQKIEKWKLNKTEYAIR
jgi:hypothetical protein